MRKVALSVAFLSAASVLSACGDDYPSNLDANTIIVYVPTDGGNQMGNGDGLGADAGCPSATFISPAPAAKLTAVDDKDDQCKANGFQIDVVLAVGAPAGTPVSLLVNNAIVPGGPQIVAGSTVTFPKVQLAAQGATSLTAVIGNSTSCTVATTYDVNCEVPTCSIAKPVLTAAKPKLNSSDNMASPGAPFQIGFEVSTSLPDGQPVILTISRKEDVAVESTLRATALAGKATFNATLSPLAAASTNPAIPTPDTVFVAAAKCTDAKGAVGVSSKNEYVVDITAPALTVTDPANGTFFGPKDSTSMFKLDANGQFNICAQTTAGHADATNLPGVLAKAKNLCVKRGMAAETCVKMGAVADKTCIPVTCPGGSPFDLTVSLTDAAGNVSTQTVTQVACASNLPTIEILSPKSDNDFTDPTKRLLAASGDSPLKDLDAAKSGAQANVVACTDKAGAKAELLVGLMGGVLTKTGSTVTVVQAGQGECTGTNLGYVAKWAGATLPESAVNIDGTISSATVYQVRVTDETTAVNTSDVSKLWVDSSAPTVQELNPSDLCQTLPSATDKTLAVVSFVFNQRVASGKLTVANDSAGTVDYSAPVFAGLQGTFANVLFPLGLNQVTAMFTDSSGNKGFLRAPCAVKVGQVPVITWLDPPVGKNLCSASNVSPGCVPDTDAATPGWQGNIKVRVDLGGVPATAGMLTLTAGGTDLPVGTIGGNGEVTFGNITIVDGPAVTLKATTSDLNGTGPGVASRTIIVDTVAPDGVAMLTVAIKNRRETSFTASWKAPSDQGVAAAAYDVRISSVGKSQVDYDAATKVAFSGVPQAPAADDKVDITGLTIEKGYYVGVVAVDAVGNRGPLVSTDQETKAKFSFAVYDLPTPRTNERFGASADGTEDLDNDGYSDVVVGSTGSSANNVVGRMAILWGASSADLADPAKRKKTIIDPINSDTGFGTGVAVLDLDGDGNEEIAAATSAGKVVIVRGRSPAVWSGLKGGVLSLTPSEVYEVPGTAILYGESVAKVGDFDGDGRQDLVVSRPRDNTNRGGIDILLGQPSGPFTGSSRIVINGGTSATFFGKPALGVGRFYSGGGTTILVSAITDPQEPQRYGRVLAFHGLSAGQNYDVTAAKGSISGPMVADSRFGQCLASLGTFGGGRFGFMAGAFTSFQPGAFGRGYLSTYFSSVAEGPLSGVPVRMSSASTTVAPDYLSNVTFSSVVVGTATSVPFLGDTKDSAFGDLVVASRSESGGMPGKIYLVDGQRLLTALPGDTDISQLASVSLSLKDYVSDWNATSTSQTNGGLVKDVDGDGWGDFVIGETQITSSLSVPGRTILFW
jgi:hypothetical protein